MSNISHIKLIKLLDYDSSTGFFINKITRSSMSKKGSRAGGYRPDGYRVLTIDKKQYLEHRLAWFYTYKEWPKNQIDHINGIRKDNFINNLREATFTENNRNKEAKGFYEYKYGFAAQITYKNKKIHLGTFDTEEKARKAYKEATLKYFKKFARKEEQNVEKF